MQHEAAGEMSGLLAMMQPDTPSPRKHSRKGKNPKSSYSIFARPASIVEADAQGQSSQACYDLLQVTRDMHMVILACCCFANQHKKALQHHPHKALPVLSFFGHVSPGLAMFFYREASSNIRNLTMCCK